MGFNFRKRIKIIPGVHINLSKSGISTSLGVKGASVNIGKRGTYLNTSIPGTGIYGRQKLIGKKKTTSSISTVADTREKMSINYRNVDSQKHPLAAFLSLLLPGLGQLTKEELFKALLIWIVGGFISILFWSTVIVPLFLWLWNIYDAYNANSKD